VQPVVAHETMCRRTGDEHEHDAGDADGGNAVAEEVFRRRGGEQ
jgi:hypothetical protein